MLVVSKTILPKPENQLKTAFIIFNVGCIRSNLDAGLFIDYFKANGWILTNKLEKADVVLVSVCGVTSIAERISLKTISKIKQKAKKGAKIIAYGCLTGMGEGNAIRELGLQLIKKNDLALLDSIVCGNIGIGSVSHPHKLSQYEDYFRNSCNELSILDQKLNFSYDSFFKVYLKIFQYCFNRSTLKVTSNPKVFTIKIASGCTSSCTYCAIKMAIGSLRSRPLETILNEFYQGIRQGYKVIRLVADDVGAYGQDIGLSIVDLLLGLIKHQESFQLLLDDFSPRWLVQYFTELLDILTEKTLDVGYISLPLQSGSEKILELMGRDYRAADFKKCFLTLKKAMPTLDLRTHVLLGFPGETERDFLDTINFLKSLDFNLVTIYKYSDRINTEASELPNKISESEKIRRVWKTSRMLPLGKVIFGS